MIKIYDYTNGNLLDYEYFSNHYKLIAIGLNKDIKLIHSDLKNFIVKLEEKNGARMFFIIEKSEVRTCNFTQNSISIILN